MSNLKSTFNWALPTAKSFLTSAGSDLGGAGSYYKKLLSGNRSDMMAAVAPEAANVRSEADAQKKQLATMGTSRGGGVSATNADIDTNMMSKIDQLLFGVRPEAAKGLTTVGAQEGALATQQGILSEYAANDLLRNTTEAKKGDSATNQGIGQAAGEIASLLLFS